MKDCRTIVVGCDGSTNATDALITAADLVDTDGTVHVVVAYHRPSEADVLRILESLPEEFRQTFDVLEGPQRILNSATTILEQHGVAHEGHLVEDDAASALLALADDTDADLIVVGSRGLGRAARFLRGSVSSRIANHADRSVMIVKERAEADGGS